MGGLGSPAALYLAAAGIGRLGLTDFDVVAEHNLQRQIIHDTPSVGSSKIKSATARISALNPHVTLSEHSEGVTVENAQALFADYDIIVDGSDNFPTRYFNNDAAVLAKKPLVYGSVFQFDGQVALFDSAAGGPCYRCLFPDLPESGSMPSCDEAGVLGALCGWVGSMQALEAIKYLALPEERPNQIGRLHLIDSWSMKVEELRIPKNPDCPVCGTNPRITTLESARYEFTCEATEQIASVSDMSTSITEPPLEIDIHTAKEWLEQSQESVELIDVREPFELEICQIKGSKQVPMGSIPEQLGTFSPKTTYVIQCHHGGRSLRVTEFLRQNGLSRVTNMAGGIDAWAVEIEAGMTRY